MQEYLSFDDVLLIPGFSEIASRKDVDLSVELSGMPLNLPIISSNMDTVTEDKMAIAMNELGGVGALHRFCSIENNVKMYDAAFNESVGYGPIASVGLGQNEFDRAKALIEAGVEVIIIDVAHGAMQAVVEQYNWLTECFEDTHVKFIVGNFATADAIVEFNKKIHEVPSAYKVGIGGGSLCTTRVQTGCGLPTFASVLDCAKLGYPIIADGGIRTSGDIAKCLAAGATAVMLGQLLAATDEAPGPIIEQDMFATMANPFVSLETYGLENNKFKAYRGSASIESYEAQGKLADHRTPEGESTLLPYKGSVKDVVKNLAAGLRSAFSYVGANNLQEFQAKAKFARITNAGKAESSPHGKRELVK